MAIVTKFDRFSGPAVVQLYLRSTIFANDFESTGDFSHDLTIPMFSLFLNLEAVSAQDSSSPRWFEGNLVFLTTHAADNGVECRRFLPHSGWRRLRRRPFPIGI